MRFLDRLISFLFDVIVIVLALTVILVMTNVVSYNVVNGILTDYVFNMNYQVMIISIAVVVVLLGLKITVFSSVLTSPAKRNIFVDTPHGKIQIAQENIEGIAKNVIKNYEQEKDVQARMTKARKGINMYMVLQVYHNTNIKDVVSRVQNDVKEQIVATTGVAVHNVDVKIKSNLANRSHADNKVVKVVKTEEMPKEPVVTEKEPISELPDENKVIKIVDPRTEVIDSSETEVAQNQEITDGEEKE